MEVGRYNNLTKKQPFTIPKQNVLLIGKSKTATFSALEAFALESIYKNESIIFIGNAETILKKIPKPRQKHVLFFSPALIPFALNILAKVPPPVQPLVASTLTDSLVKRGITPFREYTFRTYFRYGIQTLLSVKGTTILSLKKLLTDSTYRTEIVGQLTDPVLKDFWNDFDLLEDKEQRVNIESTLSLLYDIMLEPLVRNCVFQTYNRLVLKDKIVLVSLKEAELGRDNVAILRSLILSMVYAEGVQGLKTMLYVDQATDSLAPVLTGCPSIATLYTLQSLSQLQNPVFDSVLAFRTTAKDAKTLSPEMHLAPGDIEPNKLGEEQAYISTAYREELGELIAVGDRAQKLTMQFPEYQDTGHEAEVLRRCAFMCTAPKEEIEKRLGRFFT